MSMNLARWRRDVRALVRSRRKLPPAKDDFGAVLRFLHETGEEPYQERYELELLRQSGKRRKPVMRCACGAAKRRIAPRNSMEALMHSSDDWAWSVFSGWQCKACRGRGIEWTVPVARLGAAR